MAERVINGTLPVVPIDLGILLDPLLDILTPVSIATWTLRGSSIATGIMLGGRDNRSFG